MQLDALPGVLAGRTFDVIVGLDLLDARECASMGLEFDLRGLETPARRALPEVTGFDQRLRKERRKRTPDPAALERFKAELDALCDRLMAEDRAAMAG